MQQVVNRYIPEIERRQAELDSATERRKKTIQEITAIRFAAEISLREECANSGLLDSGYYHSQLAAIQNYRKSEEEALLAANSQDQADFDAWKENLTLKIANEVNAIIDQNYER